MPRRRLLQVWITIGVVAVSVVGIGSAAVASPSSFTAASIHAGGAGAVGAETVGGISWYNRSVTLTSVRSYVAAHECSHFVISGWQGGTKVTSFESGQLCAGSTGHWYPYGDIILPASGLSGGITEVVVDEYEETTEGYGFADCLRSGSTCYER
jgi:hypothetical protein